jgi:hypothetical protein
MLQEVEREAFRRRDLRVDVAQAGGSVHALASHAVAKERLAGAHRNRPVVDEQIAVTGTQREQQIDVEPAGIGQRPAWARSPR